MHTHSWLVHPVTFIAALLICLCTSIPPALADWQPGYNSGDFSGGGPNCVIEFDGRLAVGGAFTSAGCADSPGVVFTDFARFYATGNSLWHEDQDSGSVNSLAVYDGQLIAGGGFNGRYPIMGIENVARLDGNDWVSLGALRGDGSLHGGQVQELIVYEGDLIAVGNFTHSAVGIPLGGIARWNGEEWLPMGVKPPGAEALGVWNAELYCGLSVWDGATWVSLCITEPAHARVTAIDVVDDGLAFGGFFLKIGEANADGTAIYDGDTFRIFGDGASSTDDPYFEDSDYVPHGVRGFRSFAGDTYLLAPIWTPSHHYFGLSKLTPNSRGGSNWLPVEGVTWRPHGLSSGSFVDMGDRLVAVLGDRSASADLEDQGVLRCLVLQDDRWSPLIPGKGTASVPLAIASAGGSTWVASGTNGLLMESVDGLRRVDAAEYSGLNETREGIVTSGMATGGTPHVVSYESFVSAYSTVGELTFYAGIGSGGTYGPPQPPSAAVQWDAGYLVAADIPFVGGYQIPAYVPNPGGSAQIRWMDGPVIETADALIVHDGQPWLAANGQVYRLEGTPETRTTSVLVGTFNGPVNALVSDGDRLIAGGDFDSVNSVRARNLAIWDGSQWSEPLRLSGSVNALARDMDGVVYVGGEFSRVGTLDTRNLAVFRDDMVGAFPEGPNGPVEQIALTDQGFIISGAFSSVGGYCANNLAEWIGSGVAVSITDPETPAGLTPRFATLRLLSPDPNPFNPRVTISFELPRAGLVRLRVYDLAGRLVKTLANEVRNTGIHDVVWDGTDETGRAVASGVYVASLIADGRSVTRKMALVR